ncbi:hypothetical protein ACLB6G_13175 [Zhengella sp. ZM62]|uniref:hypothetical protein n=1 Tax=Zhengella sedimenti TaxID=3390035 RepID=UPI0039767FFF
MMIASTAVTATPSTGRAVHSLSDFFERRNRASTSAPSISPISKAFCFSAFSTVGSQAENAISPSVAQPAMSRAETCQRITLSVTVRKERGGAGICSNSLLVIGSRFVSGFRGVAASQVEREHGLDVVAQIGLQAPCVAEEIFVSFLVSLPKTRQSPSGPKSD